MSRLLRVSSNYSLVHCSTKLAQAAAPMSHVLSQAAGLGLAAGGKGTRYRILIARFLHQLGRFIGASDLTSTQIFLSQSALQNTWVTHWSGCSVRLR